MKKYRELEKKYEILYAQYDKLWSEKEELAYEIKRIHHKEKHFEEQSSEIRTLHENVRRLKHDMKNHMLVLAAYMGEEDYEAARKKGIMIKAEIENLGFEKMESMDFTAVLTNLLDNAIEACEKEEMKELHVLVSQKRGYEAIVVKNRIAYSVLAHNPELVSYKKDKKAHGMGVLQVKHIVDKYEGIFDFYEENNFFNACAFIPK